MMVDVKVQTMYREAEAQTFPWSPPYIQISKDVPEILLLNNLKWGKGLPAGQYEVEEISRNRKKRAWERYLASIQKTTDINYKKKIISQIESDDWEFIGQDLEKMNEYRMVLAKEVLKEQKLEFDSKLSKKINLLNEKIVERYEENIKKIQLERDKEIRRINSLTKIRYIDKHEKKTMIDKFSDKLSDMYAFKVRLGYHRKNTSIVLCEDAYNKVKESTVKQRKFSPPNRSGRMKKHNCLKEQFIDTEESEFDEYFRQLDFGFEFEGEQQKKSKEMDFIQEEKAGSKQDILEEKSFRSEKHEEFGEITTEQLDPEEVERKRQLFLQSFKQKCLEKRGKETLSLETSSIETNLLGKLITLTSKEQQRLEEEKKILAMALIAQAERWKREAREDGIRQKQKMRETIRSRILDQALERIGQDLEQEFETVLRDSLIDSAIIEVEENMRTKIYDINRSEIPKTDEGCKQEEMISQMKDHILLPQINIQTDEKEKSLSDLGEINEVVQDMYQNIISITLELDNLVSTLVESEEKSDIHLINEKLDALFEDKAQQPALQQLKAQIEHIHTEYQIHCEIDNDIKKMDKLCDTAMEIANDVYQTVLGEVDLEPLKDKMQNYDDNIINYELLKYLDKNSTPYIFKIMKMSHILGENETEKLFNNSSKIMERAVKLCKNVVKIAIKIYNYICENEYEEILTHSEVQAESDLTSGQASELKRLTATRMERLCEKLVNKLTLKDKTPDKKTKEEDAAEEKENIKIDVCLIKKEASEIVESVVEIWLHIESMVSQLESSYDTINKENVMTKLKCILEKLEDRFGNMHEFIGMKILKCSIDPNQCNELDNKLLENMRLFRPEYNIELIVDAITKAALKLYNKKQQETLNFKDLSFLDEPLKTDIISMAEGSTSKLFVALPKLLNDLR